MFTKGCKVRDNRLATRNMCSSLIKVKEEKKDNKLSDKMREHSR